MATNAYDELHSLATQLMKALERYEVAIQAGDARTRTAVPTGDGTTATGRLVEAATLAAARAWANALPYDGPDGNADTRADHVEHVARRIAARTEFRVAVDAVVKMILVRQR